MPWSQAISLVPSDASACIWGSRPPSCTLPHPLQEPVQAFPKQVTGDLLPMCGCALEGHGHECLQGSPQAVEGGSEEDKHRSLPSFSRTHSTLYRFSQRPLWRSPGWPLWEPPGQHALVAVHPPLPSLPGPTSCSRVTFQISPTSSSGFSNRP